MITVKQLNQIKEQQNKIVQMRGRADPTDQQLLAASGYKKQILVCGGTGCTSSGCKKVVAQLRSSLKKHNAEKDALVVTTGCFGLCSLGPIMIVYPEGSFYSAVKPENV